MQRFIGKLALGAGAVLAALSPAVAAPPLWVLEEGEATIYMMGTIHMMREDDDWRGPAFEAAFAEADSVWLEILGASEATMLSALVSQYGMSPERPLSETLGDADLALLETALEGYDIAPETIDSLRPWLAAVQLTAVPLLEAGLEPEHSVDLVIEAEAEAAGKSLFAFETAEEQILTLAEMSEEAQIEMLRGTLQDMIEGSAYFLEQVDLWLAGDLDALEAEAGAIETEFDEAVFLDRNIRFADAIEAMLEEPGVTLIAVGLGHFIGPDSIPDLLEQRGYSVEVR